MFAQIASALLGFLLLYIGITDKSVLNLCLGIFMLLSSASMFYAAITGSSIQEEFTKWQAKKENKQ
tara:strand:- start:181 stop:378 length:198 start_codon:yes stop_codon:yes gene_type:complete